MPQSTKPDITRDHMDKQEALSTLGLTGNETPEQQRQAHEQKVRAIQDKIDTAATDSLKIKFELMKGRSKIYALKRSYMTTGKAMILTTLILCSGFAMLVFSSFMGTFYLGIMLSLALFVALIADLTLLPVLILLFYKPRKKKGK